MASIFFISILVAICIFDQWILTRADRKDHQKTEQSGWRGLKQREHTSLKRSIHLKLDQIDVAANPDLYWDTLEQLCYVDELLDEDFICDAQTLKDMTREIRKIMWDTGNLKDSTQSSPHPSANASSQHQSTA